MLKTREPRTLLVWVTPPLTVDVEKVVEAHVEVIQEAHHILGWSDVTHGGEAHNAANGQ